IIFHLGGMLSVPSDADHAASFRANTMGTFHVLEAAKLFGVEQVIFSSTIATYGLDLEEGIVVDDYSLQRPQLFYGATKVFSELMGQFYRRKFGLDFSRCAISIDSRARRQDSRGRAVHVLDDRRLHQREAIHVSRFP
ncbi:MAG: SDR family oxidoreductase, partial [Syntrophales bacterium]